MSTSTNDDQLAEFRRRIERLRAFAQVGAAEDGSRIRRHLDALRREEASVAASEAPDRVDEKLGQLKTRVDVAEHSLTADLSGDWPTFVAAVEAGSLVAGEFVLLAFVLGVLASNTAVAALSTFGFRRASAAFPFYAGLAVVTSVFSAVTGLRYLGLI